MHFLKQFAGSKPMNLPYFSGGWVELIHLKGYHIWGRVLPFKVTRAIAEGDTIGREVEDNAKARVGI